MLKSNKKLPIFLLCFALLGFAFLSFGGEFLHDAVHHHEEHAQEEACPLYQFLVQAVIAFIVVLASLKLRFQLRFVSTYQFLYSTISRIIIHPRGPPALV